MSNPIEEGDPEEVDRDNSSSSYGESPFIFTIKTTSKNQSFTLPLKEVVGNSHNFNIDWGDLSSSLIKSFDDVNRTHIYSSAGTYQISISGNCPWFSFGHVGDRLLVQSIDQWGEVGLVNLSGGFSGCTNIKSIASDGYGLKDVTDFEGCFAYCRMVSIPTGLLDTCTKATNFNSIFYQCDCITAIPIDLFKNCIEAKSLVGAFCGCTEIKIIPEKLFDNTTKVTSLDVCFSNCDKISEAPTYLFKNYTNDISIRNAFYKTKITAIPVIGAVEVIEP